jgi:hypothetical protein
MRRPAPAPCCTAILIRRYLWWNRARRRCGWAMRTWSSLRGHRRWTGECAAQVHEYGHGRAAPDVDPRLRRVQHGVVGGARSHLGVEAPKILSAVVQRSAVEAIRRPPPRTCRECTPEGESSRWVPIPTSFAQLLCATEADWRPVLLGLAHDPRDSGRPRPHEAGTPLAPLISESLRWVSRRGADARACP